jgi:hypothetical protein
MIDAVLGRAATWIEPDAGLEDRVLGAVTARRDAGPAGAIAPVVDIRSSRRWRGRVVAGLVGAAAASIVFLGVGIAHRAPSPTLRVSLAPTTLMPGATGTAALRETNSGWEIKLDTHDLPRLDNGRFYEAWLEGPKGKVSIGTFHTGAKVTLWAGVEADEYTTLAITIQPENGDPAQSSDRVLTAPLKR